MKRWAGLVVAAAFLAFPWILSGPVYERLGALVLLAAIGASAWNIVGGYAGQVSVGHAVFFGFGAYSALWSTPISAAADRGRAARHAAERPDRRRDRRADTPAPRPLFRDGHHRRGRAGA